MREVAQNRSLKDLTEFIENMALVDVLPLTEDDPSSPTEDDPSSPTEDDPSSPTVDDPNTPTGDDPNTSTTDVPSSQDDQNMDDMSGKNKLT